MQIRNDVSLKGNVFYLKKKKKKNKKKITSLIIKVNPQYLNLINKFEMPVEVIKNNIVISMVS